MIEKINEEYLKQECESLKKRLSEYRQELIRFRNSLDNIWQTPAKKVLQNGYDDIDKIYEKLEHKLNYIDDIYISIKQYKEASSNANNFLTRINNGNLGLFGNNEKLAGYWLEKADGYKQQFEEICGRK